MAYKEYALMEISVKNNNFEYAIVKDSDGKEKKITEYDKILEAIKNYAKQEGLDPENKEEVSSLLNDETKVRRVSEVVLSDIEEKKDEKTVRNRRSERNKKESNKKTKTIVITSIVTAAVLGISGLVYHLAKKEANDISNNSSESNAYSDENNNLAEIVPQEAFMVSSYDNNTDNNYNETFASNLQNTSRYDRTISLIRRANSGERLSNYDYDYLINSIALLNQSNMAELENLIEGGRMQGDEYTLAFQNAFDYDSWEYQVIYYFMNERNYIVNEAYNQNRYDIDRRVKNFLDFYIGFVFNGICLDHNGEALGYKDLSPIAQLIVNDLGHKMLETKHDYVGYIDDYQFYYREILLAVNEKYNETVNNFVNGKTR